MPRVRGEIYQELMGAVMALLKDFMKLHAHTDHGEYSRLHIGVLGVLSREGPLAVSEAADRLMIHRPQMTVLLDRLVSGGLVERAEGAEDRRMTVLTITEAGRRVLEESVRAASGDIQERLSVLDGEDLEELGRALRSVQRILAKL